MGWCSATEIMDAVVEAADAAVAEVIRQYAPGDATAQELQGITDGVLRPIVARVASELRDGDWDCIEESKYFDRFPREMLGHDTPDYIEYLHDKLRDTGPDEHNFAELVQKLAATVAEREGQTNGAG